VRHSFSAKARLLIQTRLNETQHIASTISQGEKEIGAGNEIRTRDCRYLRVFDAFMICLQAVEFNSFLLQSDHKRIIRNRAYTLWKSDE
jgi:hypothetical protein